MENSELMDRTLLLLPFSPGDLLTNGLAYRRARAVLIMLANSRIGDPGSELLVTGAKVDELVKYGDLDPRIWFSQSCFQGVSTRH
jgi:hypothetical protein